MRQSRDLVTLTMIKYLKNVKSLLRESSFNGVNSEDSMMHLKQLLHTLVK